MGRLKCSKHLPRVENSQGSCKQCVKDSTYAWRRANPDKVLTANRRWNDKNPDKTKEIRRQYWINVGKEKALSHRYALSKEEYESLQTRQGNKCAICFEETKLHVDHNHLTNHVRGLLCPKCNKGIGLLKEDVSILYNAIAYLLEDAYDPSC